MRRSTHWAFGPFHLARVLLNPLPALGSDDADLPSTVDGFDIIYLKIWIGVYVQLLDYSSLPRRREIGYCYYFRPGWNSLLLTLVVFSRE